MPSFFIDRPIFAWVSPSSSRWAACSPSSTLAWSRIPNIAPPQVTVSASYPGASADTTEKTVTQVIEQQLTGIDHLLYFSSSSSSNGRASITLTFETGTDPDIAQVQVQNKVALATPRLPVGGDPAGRGGGQGQRRLPRWLVALRRTTPSIDRDRLNDIVASQVLDQIARVPGVGSTRQFGSEYSMRIWLNPDKLQGYGLSATAGAGARSGAERAVRRRLDRCRPGACRPGLHRHGVGRGPLHHARAVREHHPARQSGRHHGQAEGCRPGRPSDRATTASTRSTTASPPVRSASSCCPGANALDVATAVRAKMDELAKSFPHGVDWFMPVRQHRVRQDLDQRSGATR